MSSYAIQRSNIYLDRSYTTLACLDRVEYPDGSKARIHLVRQNSTSRMCIRKTMGLENRDLWRNEIDILRALSHPYVCAYVDAYIIDFPPAAALYMEYCELGDLHDLIDAYNQRGLSWRVPEAFAWQVFSQMVQALCYIHQGLEGWNAISRAATNGETTGADGWTQVLHRDIKPGNIFLQAPRLRQDRNPGTYPVAKLGDFGLAIHENHPRFRPSREETGTPGWLPPEYPNFGQRGDVWALGAVVQTLCSPERSPEGVDDQLISDHEWNEREWFPAGRAYGVEMNEAVGLAMEENKTNRPYARDLAVRVWNFRQRVGNAYEPLPFWAMRRAGW
ncbi:MAG: hypothetical protein M1835_007331 [Candelina submexicana]|nr:MAG: hypothetical protein M1835_007331 [Candelina submexicana]